MVYQKRDAIAIAVAVAALLLHQLQQRCCISGSVAFAVTFIVSLLHQLRQQQVYHWLGLSHLEFCANCLLIDAL